MNMIIFIRSRRSQAISHKNLERGLSSESSVYEGVDVVKSIMRASRLLKPGNSVTTTQSLVENVTKNT